MAVAASASSGGGASDALWAAPADRLPLPPIPDPHAARMFRVVRTARTMMRKRGFTPEGPDWSEAAFWLKHGSLLNRHALTQVGVAQDGSGERMTVFFPAKPALREVRAYAQLLRDMGWRLRHCVVVVAQGEKRTSHVRQLLLQLQQEGFPLELMAERQLYADPTANMMVPQYERLSREEAQVLLRHVVRQPPSSLPTIYTTNPIAQFLGFAADDIVKVIAPSAAAGVTLEYRRVVQAIDRSQGEEAADGKRKGR